MAAGAGAGAVPCLDLAAASVLHCWRVRRERRRDTTYVYISIRAVLRQLEFSQSRSSFRSCRGGAKNNHKL